MNLTSLQYAPSCRLRANVCGMTTAPHSTTPVAHWTAKCSEETGAENPTRWEKEKYVPLLSNGTKQFVKLTCELRSE